MKNLRYYIPGALLITFAAVIMVFPEILVAFVAASIIMAGIGALYVGHMLRKSQIEFNTFNDTVFEFDDRYFNRSFARIWRNRF
jgi:hypothetical protein